MQTNAYITVTCNECEDEEVIELEWVGLGWNDSNVRDDLQSMNWYTDDDVDVCPNCIQKMVDEKYHPEGKEG